MEEWNERENTRRFAELRKRNRNKEKTSQGLSAECNFLWVSLGLCLKKYDGYSEREEGKILELSGALFNDKTSFCRNIH